MDNPLPPLPLDMDDLIGWRNWAQEMMARVAATTLDSTPPALVANVTLNPVYPGIVVAWNPTLKADSYIVYRNTSGTFSTASPIIQLKGNGNISYFDVTQALGTGTIYYWVQGVNALGTLGPVSAMVSTANSQAPGPGIIPGVIDSSLMVLAIPDDDLPQDFGLSFMDGTAEVSGSVTFWATQADDEDYFTGPPFSGDFAFP